MPRPASARHQRLESQMRRSLAGLLREAKDPRVGNVTVTEVSLAPDLGHARVFVLPFGGTADDVAAAAPPMLAGLGHAAGFLRGELGRALQLRHAPRLEFVLDETLDRAAHLTALIDSAVKRDE
jgi:ribosome-binding factor A